MVLNSYCKIRILIGGYDFTPNYSSFAVGTAHFSESGLQKIIGSLELDPVVNPSVDANVHNIKLDPRKRPDFWFKGQTVIVDVFNNAINDWTRHPFGTLKITKEPDPPKRDGLDPKLVLEIGCDLSRWDFKQPNTDASRIVAGYTATRNQIISNILSKVGLTLGSGSVPGTLSYPIPKTETSYPEQAGKVAFGGNSLIWQKANGAINGEEININPSTPFLSFKEAECMVYEPLGSAEVPAEKTICTGTTYTVVDNFKCVETNSSSTVGPASKITGSSLAITILQLTYIKDCLDATGRFRETTVYEPEASVFPNDRPDSLALTLSSKTTEYWLYDTSITLAIDGTPVSGKLKNVYKTVLEPFAKAVSQFWSNLTSAQKLSYSMIGITTAFYSNTVYDYKSEVPTVVATIKEEPIGVIIPELTPGSINPGGLISTGVDSEQWDRIRPSEFQKITITQDCINRAYPNLVTSNQTSVKTRVVNTAYTVETSASGNTQPPSPERMPERYTNVEHQVRGEYQVQNYSGQLDRQRVYQIDYPSGDGLDLDYCPINGCIIPDLTKTAEILSKFLIGRKLGYHVELAWDDRWLDLASIIPRVDFEEIDNTVQICLADGLAFSHTIDEAIVSFDAVWLGSYVAATEGVTIADPIHIDTGETTPGYIKPPYPKVNPSRMGIGIGIKTSFIPGPAVLNLSTNNGIGIGITSAIVSIANSTEGLGIGVTSTQTIIDPLVETTTEGLGIGVTSSQSITDPITLQDEDGNDLLDEDSNTLYAE